MESSSAGDDGEVNQREEDSRDLVDLIDLFQPTVDQIEDDLLQVSVVQEALYNDLLALDGVDAEMDQFTELSAKVAEYASRAGRVSKEMTSLKESVARLTKRAAKLREKKDKDVMDRERRVSEIIQRERALVAKPSSETVVG